jgi:hypothetical protein
MRQELTPMYGLMESVIIGAKCFVTVLVLGAVMAVTFAILMGWPG